MRTQMAATHLRRSARGCGQIVAGASCGAHLCTRTEGHLGPHNCPCGAHWHDDLLVIEAPVGAAVEREPSVGAA
jgi:hypothetical protein